MLQDTASSIWAFAQLNHQPSKEFAQGVAFYTLRHWAQMKAGDIVKTLAALVLVGGCPVASWQQLLLRFAGLSTAGLPESDLQQIYQTYLLLKAKGKRLNAYQSSFIAISRSSQSY